MLSERTPPLELFGRTLVSGVAFKHCLSVLRLTRKSVALVRTPPLELFGCSLLFGRRVVRAYSTIGVVRAHSCFGVAFKHMLKRTPLHFKIRVARAYSTIGVVRVFSAVRPLSCSSVLHLLELFGHTLVSELLSNISLSVLQHIGVAFKHKFKRTPLPGLEGRERTPPLELFAPL